MNERVIQQTQMPQAAEQLIAELSEVLALLNHGSRPDEARVSKILQIIDEYERDKQDGNNAKNHDDLSIVSDFKAIFRENDKCKDKEDDIIKELGNNIQAFRFLFMMMCRGVADSREIETCGETGDFLTNHNYIKMIEDPEIKKDYLVLTEKGRKTITSRKILRKIQTILPYVVPVQSIRPLKDWSRLYLKRLELLTDYFSAKQSTSDYFVCEFNKRKDFLYGCTITDHRDTTYVIPCVFETYCRSDDMAFIQQLASLTSIDCLILVVSSIEDEDIIAKELNLGDSINGKVIYHIASRGY